MTTPQSVKFTKDQPYQLLGQGVYAVIDNPASVFIDKSVMNDGKITTMTTMMPV